MALSKITTNSIADDAVTNAKVADDAVDTAQIADDAVENAQIADNAVANAQMADNAVGTSEIADDAVTTAKVNPAQTDITSVGNLTGLTVRNSSTTGPSVNVGTSSTSVADDGVLGTLDFTSGSSNTVNARLQAKQYGTSENAGYFSHELRAPNGNSLGESRRELITQNAHGGIYIKRPMPANIFYYREVFKSVNISASQGATTFLTLNQNDYYISIACIVDFWTLDTNYPTSALYSRYGLCANTHTGRASWSTRFTSLVDMREYNTGASDTSSSSVNHSLSISTTKSAGSNNGYLYIKYGTGSYTEASATMRLSGMFLNTRFDDQTVTADL